MKITITPTDAVTTINGGPCRVWRGTTWDGVDCTVYVAAVAVRDDVDLSAFERRLREIPEPRELSPPGAEVLP